MRTSRRRRNKTSLCLNKSLSLFLTLILGGLLGTIIAFLAKDNFLKNNNFNLTNSYCLSDFFKLYFKHIQLPVALWFCGFVKFGFLVILILLLVKAAGLSFTAVILSSSLGIKGVIYCVSFLLIENFILIFNYLFLAEKGFKFIKERSFKLKGYFLCLLLSLFFTIFVVLFEIFIPGLIGRF